uniref:Uncharacterized protein n=1 Tax=Panagrolaimus sp. ES5 TaxID=591445 RepID=A0AC34EZH7_9BILA
MAQNIRPNLDQDNLLSDAINNFLQKEREEKLQEEMLQWQQAEAAASAAARAAAATQPENLPNPESPPQNQSPNLFSFFNANLEIDLPEHQALPSTIARCFGIEKAELQLKRKSKIFKVHDTEDKFVPPLKNSRGKFEVLSTPSPPEPQQPSNVQRQRESSASQFHDCVEDVTECTIILNNQQSKLSGGTITKAQIAASLGIQRTDFRLIGQDGTITSQRNQFTLNPGAKYHVIHPNQSLLQSVEEQVVEQISAVDLSLNVPMSYSVPYFISVLRILWTLSFTDDAVKFNDEVIQETKTSTILCPKTLSTCAYQVAYGFNEIANAIQNVSSKIAKNSYKKPYDSSSATSTSQKYEVVSQEDSDDDEDEQHHDDATIIESPLKDFAEIIELHQKSITELDDFLKIVMKQMRANNPTVESVKLSLQIRAENEKHKLERKKFARLDQQELNKIYKSISENDEQICPSGTDLYEVSSNRNQHNFAYELVEKILLNFENENVFADITKLLNYCSQIAHCSLMHWMFAFETIKTAESDEKVAASGKLIMDQETKQFVAAQLFQCLKIWDTVSLAVPLSVNFDDKTVEENVHEIWENMKDKIQASQYALEIYYANANKEKKIKKGGRHN